MITPGKQYNHAGQLNDGVRHCHQASGLHASSACPHQAIPPDVRSMSWTNWPVCMPDLKHQPVAFCLHTQAMGGCFWLSKAPLAAGPATQHCNSSHRHLAEDTSCTSTSTQPHCLKKYSTGQTGKCTPQTGGAPHRLPAHSLLAASTASACTQTTLTCSSKHACCCLAQPDSHSHHKCMPYQTLFLCL